MSVSLSLQVAKGHHAIRGNSDANSGNFFPREANENAREQGSSKILVAHTFICTRVYKRRKDPQKTKKPINKIMKRRNCRVVLQGGGIPGKRRGPGKVPPHSTPRRGIIHQYKVPRISPKNYVCVSGLQLSCYTCSHHQNCLNDNLKGKSTNDHHVSLQMRIGWRTVKTCQFVLAPWF